MRKVVTMNTVDEDVSDTAGETDGKTKQLNLRVRTGQVAFWEDAAEVAGMPLAAWIKKVCTQAALDAFTELDEKYGRRNKNGK